MIEEQEDEPAYQKQRTVYVANKGWHNYEAATRHGRLVFLTEKDVDLRHTSRLRGRILDQLKYMKPDDYILISGHPLINAEVFAIVTRMFGHVNYLYWEPFLNDYLQRNTSEGADIDV